MKKYHQSIIDFYAKGYRATEEGDIISPHTGRKLAFYTKKRGGYYSINTGAGTIDVHFFIAYQKFGDKVFEEGVQVRHLDNNSKNNKDDNLILGTQSQNMYDLPKETRMRSAVNASTKIRKFSDDVVAEIKEKRSKGYKYKELMEEYGITSKGTMSHIINNTYVTVV